jgi:hypothetical protein
MDYQKLTEFIDFGKERVADSSSSGRVVGFWYLKGQPLPQKDIPMIPKG